MFQVGFQTSSDHFSGSVQIVHFSIAHRGIFWASSRNAAVIPYLRSALPLMRFEAREKLESNFRRHRRDSPVAPGRTIGPADARLVMNLRALPSREHRTVDNSSLRRLIPGVSRARCNDIISVTYANWKAEERSTIQFQIMGRFDLMLPCPAQDRHQNLRPQVKPSFIRDRIPKT